MAMAFETLVTDRMILRRITPDDAEAILGYMSDPQVTAWLPEGRLDRDGARAFALKNAGPEATALAVLHRETGAFMGHMVFHPWEMVRTYEIGWVFAQDHQRQGYATEASRALLAYAFDTLDAHRVVATCQPENTASWRVMERLGMRREGLMRQCIHRPSGVWWDEYFYAILKAEYDSRGEKAAHHQ